MEDQESDKSRMRTLCECRQEWNRTVVIESQGNGRIFIYIYYFPDIHRSIKKALVTFSC